MFVHVEVAKALANEGCNVVLVDRDEPSLSQIQSDIKTATTNNDKACLLSTLPCDVTDSTQVDQLIEHADKFASSSSSSSSTSSNNHATLLVNCAGITRDNYISKLTLEDWDQVIDTNLKGTFLTCRSFLHKDRIMDMNGINSIFETTVADDDGEADQSSRWHSSCSIVNIGSIVSELGNIGQVNYAASKGGVVGLTRALAKEIAMIGDVRVNAVLPGFIDTQMTQQVPEPIRKQICQRIPLQRFGQPKEIADLVCFLLSPRSSYITGEAIRCSGMISL